MPTMMPPKAQIGIDLINDDGLKAPGKTEFEAFLRPLALRLDQPQSLCIKIIDVDESRALNKNYRSKDKPTNVLSFPAEIPDFIESNHLGDLAICGPIVEQEAVEQYKVIQNHWAHLVIHGCLHLLGYDHIDDNEAEEMEALEIELLAELGIGNPYI